MFRQIFFILFFAFTLSHLEGKSQIDFSHPKLLIIDTDADIDDMMAILYLLKSPRVDIKGITTTGNGVSMWEYGAKNISNLLELVGYNPHSCSYGARESLSPVAAFPSNWRSNADQIAGIKLPINPVQPVHMRSSDLIADTIMKSPNKVTLFCTGPLTNLALAMEKNPEIKGNIDRIYFVGGVILAQGNVVGRPQGYKNVAAEYNVFLDAKAASDIFNSEVPITLIPLDIVKDVSVTKLHDYTLDNKDTPAANFVYEATKKQTVHISLWDSLAAVIMTYPELAKFQDLNLTINLRAGPEYGRIMMTTHKQGTMIRTAIGVDASAFYPIFLNVLNRHPNIKQNHNESK